jgi:hypothetical protein
MSPQLWLELIKKKISILLPDLHSVVVDQEETKEEPSKKAKKTKNELIHIL